MDFPARPAVRMDAPPAGIADALGVAPVEVHVHAANYLALLDSPAAVRALAPDFAAIARLDRPGLIVTAQGEGEFDFTSRYFAPAKGVDEDPVTGGAHCMLAPFWAPRLRKQAFVARQASRAGRHRALRGGGRSGSPRGWLCFLSRRRGGVPARVRRPGPGGVSC